MNFLRGRDLDNMDHGDIGRWGNREEERARHNRGLASEASTLSSNYSCPNKIETQAAITFTSQIETVLGCVVVVECYCSRAHFLNASKSRSREGAKGSYLVLP